MHEDVSFHVAMRGFDRRQVDALVDAVEPALRAGAPEQVARALSLLDTTRLTIRMRGYDAVEVREYLASARARLQAAQQS